MPDDVGKRRVGWLLRVYRQVLKARWDTQIAAVQATELGTARALAQALSSKKVGLPELPTFDKMLRAKLPPEARLPEWMRKFEAANKPPD